MLKKYFAEKHSADKLLAVEMGAGFREFFKHDRYTAKLAKKITEAGGLQPVFLTVSIWGKFFIEEMTEGANILIDGAPRRKLDAEAMETAFDFYDRSDIDVLVLHASGEEVTKRLLKRGRNDDTHAAIADRLSWYESEVVPALDVFRSNPRYRIRDINGEQSIEKVFEEIIAKIS